MDSVRPVLIEIRAWVRKCLLYFDIVLVRIFSLTGFTSSLYYLLFSRKFYREHRTVLRGRLAYYVSLKKSDRCQYLLRRNIHRLEKALVMRPRRSVFAENYIVETVDHFCLQCSQGRIESTELKWFKDVLSYYFTIVNADAKRIAKAKKKYLNEIECEKKKLTSIPYEYGSIVRSNCTFESLEVLFKQRRAVRSYLEKEVEIEKIYKAIDAAKLAPSACNRQPFRFYVANKKDMARRIAGCAMGTSGYVNEINCIVAVVGDLSAFLDERDRHLIYIDTALVSMQLMLAFEPLGLSTCPINWPDIESREKKIAGILGLKDHERVTMLLSVGYADGEGGIPFSQKKHIDQLVVEVK